METQPTREETLKAMLVFLNRVDIKGTEAIMHVTCTNLVKSELMEIEAAAKIPPITTAKLAGKAAK